MKDPKCHSHLDSLYADLLGDIEQLNSVISKGMVEV